MPGRSVQAILVKRTNPRWLDWYGHWWVELGEESYGWWPERRPVSMVAALRGVSGRLNGLGGIPGGSSSRDPRHGEPADHAFHPEVEVGRSDEEVVAAVRAFAAGHRGQWRLWWAGRGGSCRTFQHDLLAAAGLSEPPGYRHTHGGCPFLALARRVMAPVLEAAGRHQARPVSRRGRRPAGLVTGQGCRPWARHAVVPANTTGESWMKEILRRAALLERVGTLVRARRAQPSASNLRSLRPPHLSAAAGAVLRSYLISDDETHRIGRPGLAAGQPG